MIPQATSNSKIQRVDDRVRIVAALLLAVMIGMLTDLRILVVFLALGIFLLPTSGLPARWLVRRFLAINLFTLICFAILPFSMPGQPLRMDCCELTLSKAGLLYACGIGLRLNAIVGICTTLLSTIEPAHLGTALRRLHVPAKLTELLFLTIRYIGLLRDEYERMRNGMKTRGYRPRLSLHNLRAAGYLIGGLLARSFARSEMLVAAMRCRGYSGRFPSMQRPRPLARTDFCVIVGTITVLAAAIYWELRCRQIL